jgi:hypothetical protein
MIREGVLAVFKNKKKIKNLFVSLFSSTSTIGAKSKGVKRNEASKQIKHSYGGKSCD